MESSLKHLSSRPHSVAALVAAAMVGTPARAELINVQWDGQGAYERSVQIGAGKLVEVCTRLTRGQTIAWSFKSLTALNFNVHYHEGQKVVFPEKRDAVAELSGELKVPVDQDYCWMWSNKAGVATSLSVRLQRQP